jgi:hypothetical protein
LKVVINVLIAVVLAALRIAGHKSIMFQGIAHVYVGGLFGVWLADRSRKGALALGVALTVVEVLCFLFDKWLL